MKLDFSEFSYGYAFTENLIRWSASGPSTAPVFPNLVQEAQLGYDVKIDMPGLPLFFQFKLPELMVRETAREISVLGLPGLTVPFFRMPLMRRNLSDQHIHLIRLEARFPNSVLYASPMIEDSADFNAAYGRAEVHLHSALFSPSDIGPLPDDDNHAVAYSAAARSAWRCSEPREVKIRKFDDLVRGIDEDLMKRADRSLEDTAGEIRQGVLSLLPPELRDAEAKVRDRIETRRQAADGSAPMDDRVRSVTTDLLVMRELVRVGLGVDLLVVQPRDPKKAKKKP